MIHLEYSVKSYVSKSFLQSKKLPYEKDEGEVSEEDEGGETKRSTFTKKIKLCKELSSLISIPRTRYSDIASLRANSKL